MASSETVLDAAVRLQDQRRTRQDDDAAVLQAILVELRALRADLARAIDAL